MAEHRTADPACTMHEQPRGWLARRRYDRARGMSCLVCHPPYAPKAFREYEAPKPVEEYRYRVEEGVGKQHHGHIYTDDLTEAGRMLHAMKDDGYDESYIVDQEADRG